MATSNGNEDENAKKPLRIGVLYEQTQMSDLAGLDVLGSMSTKVLNMVSNLEPSVKTLLPLSRSMEFLYISSTLEPAWTTPEMFVRPTHTYANAPRDLDIILLGGPDPAQVHEESLVFLQEASKQTQTIMATCTGGLWLARSGILDGKKATTNRMFLGTGPDNTKTRAAQFFPAVEWVDQRWVISPGHFPNSQIWTSGGAGCGIDMMIEFAKQNFDTKIVEVACAGLEFDVEGRGLEYKGKATGWAELIAS